MQVAGSVLLVKIVQVDAVFAENGFNCVENYNMKKNNFNFLISVSLCCSVSVIRFSPFL